MKKLVLGVALFIAGLAGIAVDVMVTMEIMHYIYIAAASVILILIGGDFMIDGRFEIDEENYRKLWETEKEIDAE